MSTPDVTRPALAAGAEPGPGVGERASREDPFEVLLDHLRRHPRVDAAALLLTDDDGETFRPAAGWFVTPLLRDAGAALTGGAPHEGGPTLLQAIIARSRPLFLPRVEAWEAAPALREQFDRHDPSGAAWEEVRDSSVIGCAVRTARGRTLGVLIAAALDAERPLQRSDLEMLEVLADLGALAQERSDLLSGEATRARRELLLKRASEATAGSLESSEVERRIVEQARTVIDADHARISSGRGPGARLAVTAEDGAPVDPRSAGLDAATLADVARQRRPIRRGGAVPSAHVPITLGPRLFGVLSVVRLSGVAIADEELELIQALARIAAAGLANALDFERERRIATTLTRGFVPTSLPEIPGYEIGLLYEPADVAPVGGDVYGVWPLPSGRVAVLVGDVAGKGVETAAMSAMARFFIEARSWDRESPGEVLALAGSMLAQRTPPETFVTAFLAFLDDTGITYANAGHLAPIVARAGAGGSETLVVPGLPLGIDPEASYPDHTVSLAPGDLLYGYTDGVVEARLGQELFGGERLERAVARISSDGAAPQELVEVVRDEVRAWASGLQDDVVELAVRRRA